MCFDLYVSIWLNWRGARGIYCTGARSIIWLSVNKTIYKKCNKKKDIYQPSTTFTLVKDVMLFCAKIHVFSVISARGELLMFLVVTAYRTFWLVEISRRIRVINVKVHVINDYSKFRNLLLMYYFLDKLLYEGKYSMLKHNVFYYSATKYCRDWNWCGPQSKWPRMFGSGMTVFWVLPILLSLLFFSLLLISSIILFYNICFVYLLFHPSCFTKLMLIFYSNHKPAYQQSQKESNNPKWPCRVQSPMYDRCIKCKQKVN